MPHKAAGELRLAILQAVKGGPLPAKGIAELVPDSTEQSVLSCVYIMARPGVGLLEVYGTVAELKLSDRFPYPSAKCFGLRRDGAQRPVNKRRNVKRRARKPLGSGIIAPPPYRTGFRWPGRGL